MKSSLLRWSLWFAAALTVMACWSVSMYGQEEDIDPNSPTPVLISEPDSTRALAAPDGVKLINLSRFQGQAFPANSRVTLFATNLDFAEGEGVNALRVAVQDAQGRLFRFPVVNLQLFRGTGGPTAIYALTIEVSDSFHFWDFGSVEGDTLVGLTWRGLLSNRTRLGINHTGGGIKDDEGAVPTPMENVVKIRTQKASNRAAKQDAVGYKWAGDRRRFLEQATFGPTQALDDRIRRVGLKTWLAEQLDPTLPYPSTNNPYPNDPLKPDAGRDTACDGDNTLVPDVPVTCFRDTYGQYKPQTWFMREAYYGNAQLKHRIAFALSQIWVTSGVDVTQGRHEVEYWKVLSRNAFGNYKDLMKEMTLHPTMGDYLSMGLSTRLNPNENYAREIMQLFTVGLFMLNQDGTLQKDNNGDPIPTYSQDTVNNLTRVFTGWSTCSVAASCPNMTTNVPDYIDPMLLNSGVTVGSNNRHDIAAKTLLQYANAPYSSIPACATTSCFLNCPATGNCSLTGGGSNAQALAGVQAYASTSLDQAIENIFQHPNVAPFVSKNLIQQLITSDPSPAYVARVAAVFNNNGFNVKGDMKSVIRAILLDPEARGDVKTDPSYGKLREPILYTTNFARNFGVRSADGSTTSDGYIANGNAGAGGLAQFNAMAQIPFFSPTVFNFFPPDYIIPGTGYPGPEFAIMNTGTTVARANFINQLVFVNTPIGVSNPNAPNGTSFDYSDLQALAAADTSGNLLLDELNRRLLHGTMSPQMKSTILPAVTAIASTDTLNRTRQALYLVATSSQYQVQR